MVDLVIREINGFRPLFDAEAFLDEDGDLRLKLTYLDKEKNHIDITTGKIYCTNLSVNYCEFDKSIDAEIVITPDKSGELFIMETYK